MFSSFFRSRRWALWAWLGMIVIVGGTYYQVQVDVMINKWFGEFYDMVQKALSAPNAVTQAEFYGALLSFFKIAGVYVVVATLLSFFSKHWVFRWRTAMNDFYTANWEKLRRIEGASQRVQEDTKRFAAIMEGLGTAFLDSVMTLFAFLPILWGLSKNVTELPFFGQIDHSLVYVAIVFALFGTVVLAAVGFKLPGLEFNNQVVEAAYRKELVYGEDDPDRINPPTVTEFFGNVRKNSACSSIISILTLPRFPTCRLVYLSLMSH
jgi:peptide/bleomycin uptake transporter